MGEYNQFRDTFKNCKLALHAFDPHDFEALALASFQLQAKENKIYSQYIAHMGIKPNTVKRIEQIPFLPISFFRSQRIVSGNWKEDTVFLSSTTTNTTPSRHHIKELAWYHSISARIFRAFYGRLDRFHFLALIPSYTKKNTSSLSSMINHFIEKSESPHSGFYLKDPEKICKKLCELRKSTKKTILWGVSFALMDLAEQHKIDLSHCTIIETGGMKGRREEITRATMHAFLCKRFNTQNIHSEYGMTELCSQAYAKQGGLFRCPDWMRIVVRDLTDPFERCGPEKSGGINIIDLANLYTCSFIETQDIGIQRKNDHFEVLGRIDNADIRGCNLSIV